VRSLAPLQPRPAELDEAFERLRAQGRKLARRLDSPRLQQALAQPRG
jgi:hypothetical protein